MDTANNNETVRVEGNTPGEWVTFDCTVTRREEKMVEIVVPKLRGTWLIGEHGMVANIGGNDWAIYTLHPEDVARLFNGRPE